jgi:hypothetical protein
MLFFGSKLGVITLAATALFSCEQNVSNQPKSLDGYAGLRLGSTFEEAMAIVPPRIFNPFGLKECLEDMPIKGCFLSPTDDFAIFKRVEGIPYTVQLEFNRFGALTDITLKFLRQNRYDADLNMTKSPMTKAECADIMERTIDWVVKDYGQFERYNSEKAEKIARTKSGNSYLLKRSTDDRGFEAFGEVKMDAGRTVSMMSHFIILGEFGPFCSISVSFEEASNVERRPSG